MSLSRLRPSQVESQYPSEIIFEILSRVTVETLDSCKFVSKEWKNLISEKGFRIAFSRRNNNFAGYFFQDYPIVDYGGESATTYIKNPPKFVSVSEPNNGAASVRNWGFTKDMEIVASCKQGIVLLKQLPRVRDVLNYFIAKPAVSRKWTPLPEPVHGNCYDHFGIVVLESNPLWFKVVSLVSYLKRLYYQIFDSKLWKWGKAEVSDIIEMPIIVINNDNAVSISGSIYWQTGDFDDGHVVAFNGLDESFHVFPLPDQVMMEYWRYEHVQIQELGGSLALFSATEKFGLPVLEVWEMKDSLNYQWSKKMEVSTGDSIKRCYCEGLHDEEIFYLKLLDEIVIYASHPTHNEYNRIELCYRIFPFGHDLGIL